MTSLLHAVMSATLVSGGLAEPSPPSRAGLEPQGRRGGMR